MACNRSVLSRLFIYTFYAALCCTPVTVSAASSSLVVKVHGDLVDIQANRVAVTDILRELDRQSGITVKINAQVQKVVSIQKKNVSVEDLIRKVLKNINYILLYGIDAQNQLILSEVQIFSRGSSSSIADQPFSFPSNHRIQEKKHTYDTWVMDREKLVKDLTVNESVSIHKKKSIQLTDIADNSFFIKIGLQAGDFVQDVNGQSTTTKQELINALQAASTMNPPVVRIERLRANRTIDPIYIELH